MKAYEIIPYKRVGAIEFGYEREKVRKILGDFTEFKKTKKSQNTSDDFGHLHVFYNQENKCEAIELFPEADVFMDRFNVFYMSVTEIKRQLQVIDPEMEVDDDTITSLKYGISVYAPGEEVESILAFVKGYYHNSVI